MDTSADSFGALRESSPVELPKHVRIYALAHSPSRGTRKDSMRSTQHKAGTTSRGRSA